MSENKKASKVLLRNSSVASASRKSAENANGLKKVHFSEEISETPPAFTAPEFCTLLQLADEMKMIKKIKSLNYSFPQVAKSINVNFLPEEKIFQDLVGLEVSDKELVNDVKIQPCIKLKKDPEIDFSKYKKYDLQPEYFFTSYFTPPVQKQKTVFEGHSVYQNLLMWSELD